MRCNLWDDPRVARLCDLTGGSEAAIVGGLYWLWTAADQHSEDGIMPGLSAKSIDRKTGIKGLGDALLEIGWLADHPEGVRIVRFEEHNGRSAKRRCSESVRKMSARDADNVRTESGSGAEEVQQSCAPREEKRREEVNPITSSGCSTADGAQAPPPPKRATQLPADFEPDPTGMDYAATRRLDAQGELDAFRNHHTAKGSTFKNWQAAWRTWCDKAVQFGRGGSAPNARASPSQTVAEKRERVSMVLTGRGKAAEDGQGGSSGGRERDITGEATRVA